MEDRISHTSTKKIFIYYRRYERFHFLLWFCAVLGHVQGHVDTFCLHDFVIVL